MTLFLEVEDLNAFAFFDAIKEIMDFDNVISLTIGLDGHMWDKNYGWFEQACCTIV